MRQDCSSVKSEDENMDLPQDYMNYTTKGEETPDKPKNINTNLISCTKTLQHIDFIMFS